MAKPKIDYLKNNTMGNNEETPAKLKPQANSPASAGDAHRDEDAADQGRAANETSKGFDRDQEELELGLDDGDLDNDTDQDQNVIVGATRARELDDMRDRDFTD